MFLCNIVSGVCFYIVSDVCFYDIVILLVMFLCNIVSDV